MCISICSRKNIRKVSNCGIHPMVKRIGKKRINAADQEEKTLPLSLVHTLTEQAITSKRYDMEAIDVQLVHA